MVLTVAHTFLIDAGRWMLEGNWLESNGAITPIKGKTLVSWSQDEWFTMITKLMFPESNPDSVQPRPDIIMQYRGRIGSQERQYTFVLQHSLFGRVEGEGWIAPQSIVQRFWVLNDRDRRSGFETMIQESRDRYHLSSGVLAGHNLISLIEAKLERQPD